MNKSEQKEYKFKGRVIRNIYHTEDFKVYAVSVDKTKYPEIKMNKYSNISICGELPDLTDGVEYEISGYETTSKNGVSYKVLNIKRDIPTTQEDMYMFLSEILTANQANELWREYPDIVQRVKENRLDDIDLNKLKGIKQYTFNCIVNKITENFCLADLVIEFQGYLSLSIIKKIYNKYTSVLTLKNKLKKNPYKCLCGLAGVGFKTADSILLDIEKISKENIENGKEPIIEFDYDLRTSMQRCLSCLIYLLEENEKNGHTKMNLAELRSECLKLVPKCADHFVEAVKSKEIIYNKDTMDVALKYTYDSEYFIAQILLLNLNNITDKDIWDIEVEKYRTVNEFDLSDEQMQTLKNLCENKICILNGAAGCVDADTEFFNGYEWKRIADYKYGDKVLQYNEDGTAELVYPMDYIKQKAEYLWHFKTKNGLDQCLSDNHTCYYKTRWGVYKKELFLEIKRKQEESGFTGKFLTTFKCTYNNDGIYLTDNDIRIMVMVIADGCYVNNPDNNYVRLKFKKERKIKRCIDLLEQGKYKYTMSTDNDGYTIFHIHTPIRAKHFPKSWFNATSSQLSIISDEVMYWDGTFSSRERYTTSSKEDADFIQYVFVNNGYKAIIETYSREGEINKINDKEYIRKSKLYTVTRTTINEISMSVETRNSRNFGKTQIEKYKTIDGYEYCFTVQSHLLVLRRNNRIFITGNCGKSFSTQGIINMLEDNNISYKLLTPTGKSSKVLADFTKRKVCTIHRGLGYTPDGFYYCDGKQVDKKSKERFDYYTHFTFNKYHKLNTDVIIVDEFSMVDVSLFEQLLNAIDFTHTKLLLVGDNAQLTSVGCGNLLHDMMESKIIPTSTLTKVFRYGEGGLMKVATDVRFCKQYLNSSMKNTATIFGANKDYTFVDVPSEQIPKQAVALYKKLLSNGYSIEDIQVLSAKNVGDCGTVVLNNMIQQIANKNYNSGINMKCGETTYYVDDIVIQKVNNYKAVMDIDSMEEWEKEFYANEKEAPTAFIANGETGIVKYIGNSSMKIDFDGIVVVYEKSDLPMLSLGYSISIHKSQGSSIKVPIVVTPSSHVWMCNSNLLYVALTRMKEKCFHLGDLNTVNTAVRKKANLFRNTMLQFFLANMTEDEYKAIAVQTSINKEQNEQNDESKLIQNNEQNNDEVLPF